MNILYVSTFNKEIFNASGSKMLDSFFATQANGDILCCYEELNPLKSFKKYTHSNRFKYFDLKQSDFLQDWLETNKDVIPVECGGTATKQTKPEAFLAWNFRASGWFRKIASLNYAKTLIDEYDAIVFVDSDSKFIKNIDAKIYRSVFKDHNYFYHWGKERKKKELGVESGFIGFKNDEKGVSTLDLWINKYRDKAFKRYMRWDDGGMFGNVLHEINFKYGNDLVTNYNDLGKSQSHVLERGIFSGYVLHEKGLHKRLGITNENK